MKYILYAVLGAIAFFAAVKIFAIVFWQEAVEIIFSSIEFTEMGEEDDETGRGEL